MNINLITNSYYFIIRIDKAPEIAYRFVNKRLPYFAIGTSFDNVLQLLGLIVLFFAILIGSVLVTRWIGLKGMNLNQSKNISVIETYRISQNKYIQILKIGDLYVAIAVAKDSIEFLSTLDKDSIIIDPDNNNMSKLTDIFKLMKNNKNTTEEKKHSSFKDILEKANKGNDINDKHNN